MVLPDISAVRNFNFYKQTLRKNADKFNKEEKITTEVNAEVDYTKL